MCNHQRSPGLISIERVSKLKWATLFIAEINFTIMNILGHINNKSVFDIT